MGGACSAVTEALGIEGAEVPEIEVDEEQVERIVQRSGKKIAKNAKANYKKFPAATEKCSKKTPPEAFKVPEVKDMTLEFDKAEKKDYVKASVLAAAGQPVKDEITNEVWLEIKPDLSKQVPDNVPSSIKNKALNKCKDTVVAPMVNKSIDKVLDKIIEKMNNSDNSDDSDDEKEEEAAKK
jgi:hypothetical protein